MLSSVKLRFCVSAFLTLCVGWSTSTAHAQLDVYDGFNYSTGTLSGKSGGGSLGWSGTWSGANPVKSGSLADLNLQTTGNSVEAVGGNTSSFRSLATTYGGNNQTLFLSFLARVDPTTGSQPGTSYGGISLFNVTEELFLGIPSGATDWGMVDDPGTGPYGLSTTTANITTHLLVYELQYSNTGTVNLLMFMDPTPGATSPGTPVAFLANQAAFTFNQVRIQSGSTLDVDVDELRIGQTFGSVVPEAMTPEPSALVVFGIPMAGILGLTLRRRPRVRVTQLKSIC